MKPKWFVEPVVVPTTAGRLSTLASLRSARLLSGESRGTMAAWVRPGEWTASARAGTRLLRRARTPRAPVLASWMRPGPRRDRRRGARRWPWRRTRGTAGGRDRETAKLTFQTGSDPHGKTPWRPLDLTRTNRSFHSLDPALVSRESRSVVNTRLGKR